MTKNDDVQAALDNLLEVAVEYYCCAQPHASLINSIKNYMEAISEEAVHLSCPNCSCMVDIDEYAHEDGSFIKSYEDLFNSDDYDDDYDDFDSFDEQEDDTVAKDPGEKTTEDKNIFSDIADYFYSKTYEGDLETIISSARAIRENITETIRQTLLEFEAKEEVIPPKNENHNS